MAPRSDHLASLFVLMEFQSIHFVNSPAISMLLLPRYALVMLLSRDGNGWSIERDLKNRTLRRKLRDGEILEKMCGAGSSESAVRSFLKNHRTKVVKLFVFKYARK